MKRLALAFCALAASAVQTFALDKLTLGTVPTVGDGPLICAIERGYFRELGLEVELVPFQGVIQMMPLIVRGDLKMIGGTLDRCAGLLFNVKPNGDYLTVRFNGTEDNVVLWKFVNGVRSLT